MVNFYFKNSSLDDYVPFSEIENQLKVMFCKGGEIEFYTKFEIEAKEGIDKLEDVMLAFSAIFGDIEYKFLKTTQEIPKVFVSNTKNEKRIFLTVEYGDVALMPDDNGYIYVDDSISIPGSFEIKIKFEVEAGFTKTFSEKSSFSSLAIDLITSTEV